MKTRIKIIVGVGITYGIFLALAKNMMKLNQKEMIKLYVMGALLIIFYMMSINVIEMLRVQKRMAHIAPILQVQQDSVRFVQEIETLLSETKLTHNKNILTMNLAAGNALNGDYKKAYQLLLSVNQNNLLGVNQAIYFNNMANFIFNLGEEKEAVAIMKENQSLFGLYEKNPVVGCCIAINRVYLHMTEKDMNKAKEYLVKADKLCNMPYLKDEIEYLKADILIQEDCLEEARVLIEGLKERKLTMSLKSKIMKLEGVL